MEGVEEDAILVEGGAKLQDRCPISSESTLCAAVLCFWEVYREKMRGYY